MSMTEFAKATKDVKQIAVEAFRKELIDRITIVYEHEYPTASGEFDEFYRDVINIIKNT